MPSCDGLDLDWAWTRGRRHASPEGRAVELTADAVAGGTSVDGAADALIGTLAMAYEAAFVEAAPEPVEEIVTGLAEEAPLTTTAEQSAEDQDPNRSRRID